MKFTKNAARSFWGSILERICATPRKTTNKRRGLISSWSTPLLLSRSGVPPRRRRARGRHKLASQGSTLAVETLEARSLLSFSPRGAAHDIAKLIDSAAANAENNHDLVADDLRIAEINVDEGPILKRWRARARGRATRIEKKTSHVTVALTPTAD